MGAYLGLFNGTICVPQIVAALVGGALLHLVGGQQVGMLVLAGVLLIAGAACVFIIKETYSRNEEAESGRCGTVNLINSDYERLYF